MMIKEGIFITILFLLTIILFCKKVQKKDIIDAEFESYIKNSTIQLKIKIPKDHHSYLDSGEDHTFIPVQFDWSDFKQKQILTKEPILISKPIGEYDKELKATLFREEGIFEFKVQEIIDPSHLKKGILKIKLQMCNDVSGICYRPKTYDVSL